jgi:hypothetical protein
MGGPLVGLCLGIVAGMQATAVAAIPIVEAVDPTAFLEHGALVLMGYVFFAATSGLLWVVLLSAAVTFVSLFGGETPRFLRPAGLGLAVGVLATTASIALSYSDSLSFLQMALVAAVACGGGLLLPFWMRRGNSALGQRRLTTPWSEP